MQTILITTHYSDLYSFLHAMVLETQAKFETPLDNIVIWSPEQQSELLDSQDKLDLIQVYATRLKVSVTLSASSDPVLREWGKKAGWTVLGETTKPMDDWYFAAETSYSGDYCTAAS